MATYYPKVEDPRTRDTAPMKLRGRRDECAALDALLAHVRGGQSEVLVLRGEAGIGKTVLLEHAAEQATAAGVRVARCVGVQGEMELAFAGLHQLCGALLDDGLRALPAPQQDALRVAFGLQQGETPNRFLVALATLSLLAEAAEAAPLVCLFDDAQWLDSASAQVLAFVARRLLAERIGMVFAVRDQGGADLAGLPELRVEGLSDADALALLQATLTARSTRPCATGSSPRRAATRSRCWSCRAASRPPSWPAASAFRTRARWPAGSSRRSTRA